MFHFTESRLRCHGPFLKHADVYIYQGKFRAKSHFKTSIINDYKHGSNFLLVMVKVFLI